MLLNTEQSPLAADLAVRIRGTAITFVPAGSTQANGPPIQNTINYVTAADGTKVGVLPQGTAGDWCVIDNDSGVNTLPVFPSAGGAIKTPGTGYAAANASYTQTANSTVIYVCVVGGASSKWVAFKSA